MELENYEQKFEGLDFTEQQFRDHAFEQCEFLNCNFTKASFCDALFENCLFENCNLANINLSNCKWQAITFKNSKISGLDMEPMSKMLLEFSFDKCALGYSNFQGLKIPNTPFLNCEIKECDFIGTDLSQSDFSGSNLFASNFNQCDLQKANFITALNYRFDLNSNKVKGAKFSSPEVLNFLEPFGIIIK